MNSKYKGSRTKSEKKDLKDKRIASSSRANQKRTNLEPVDEQAIIESTNETAKRQVTPRQKTDETAKKQATPRQKTDETEKKQVTPRQKTGETAKRQVTPRQKTGETAKKQVTPRQKTGETAKKQVTPRQKTGETAKQQATHPNTHVHSIENILKRPHQDDSTESLKITRNKLKQGRPKALKSQVQKQPTQQQKLLNVQQQQTYADLYLKMSGPLQVQNTLTTESLEQILLRSERQQTLRNPQQTCSHLDVSTQSQKSESPSQKEHTNSQLLNIFNQPLQSQKLPSFQSQFKQSQPRNQQHIAVQQQTRSHLDVSAQSQTSQKSHFWQILPQVHQETSTHQQESLLQENKPTNNSLNREEQLSPYEHQEDILSPFQRVHPSSPLMNLSSQLSQSQNLQSSQTHLKQSQPRNQQLTVAQQQTQSQLDFSSPPETSRISHSKTILPQDCRATSSHQQELLLQENPSTDNSLNHQVQLPPHGHQEEILSPSQEHPNSPSPFIRLPQSQEEIQRNTEDLNFERRLPRDLQPLKISELTPKIDLTFEELLESYLPSHDKN